MLRRLAAVGLAVALVIVLGGSTYKPDTGSYNTTTMRRGATGWLGEKYIFSADEFGSPLVVFKSRSDTARTLRATVSYGSPSSEVPVSSLPATVYYTGTDLAKHTAAYTFGDSIRTLGGDTLSLVVEEYASKAWSTVAEVDTVLSFNDYTTQTWVFAYNDSATAVASLDTTPGWPASVDRVINIRNSGARYGTISYHYPTAANAVHYTRFYAQFNGVEDRLVMPDLAGTDPRNYAILFYAAIDSLLPAGANILDAKLYLKAQVDFNADATDTLGVFALSPQDSMWYRFGGVGSYDVHAPASWTYQKQGYDVEPSLSAYGFPALSEYAWSPALETRTAPWEWGTFQMSKPYGPSCGSGLNTAPCNSHSHLTGEWAAADFDMLLSAWLNGDEKNNGFVLMSMESDDGDDLYRVFPPDNPQTKQLPYFVVTFTDRPPAVKYPGGYDCVFLLTTDDAREEWNAAVAYEVEQVGGNYTIYVDGRNVGSDGVAPWDSLRAWHSRGHDIGGHSRWHAAPGISQYRGRTLVNYTDGCDPDVALADTATSTAGDSLYADTDPAWIIDGMGFSGERVAESFAFPYYATSSFAQEALVYHGYTSARGQQGGKMSYGYYSPYKWGVKTTVGVGDTLVVGRDRLNPWSSRPVGWLAMTKQTPYVVGSCAAPVDSAEVYATTRWYFEKAKADKSDVVMFVTHDSCDGDYSGKDATIEQVRAMLQAAVDANAWITTVADWVAWEKSLSVPMSTPASSVDDWVYEDAGTGYWRKLVAPGAR